MLLRDLIKQYGEGEISRSEQIHTKKRYVTVYEQIVINQVDKRRADICALVAFHRMPVLLGIDSLSRNVAMELRFYAA